MKNKKILLVEDILQSEFMEDLFRRNLNKRLYELRCIPDMSDDRYYHKHLPEDYDIYWLYSSAVEWGVIEEVRRNQPWSKVVVRSGVAESKYAYNLLKREIADVVISPDDGLNEEKIIRILKGIGINILLPKQGVNKK